MNMKLNDFIIDFKSEIDTFHRIYINNHNEAKEAGDGEEKNWPLEMDYADWLDQFLIFINTGM